MTTIEALNGILRVDDVSIHACPLGKEWGTTGTLYHGDADLIADYIAEPVDTLDIYGCIHHINLSYDSGVFTLMIEFMSDVSMVMFDHTHARNLIFALAGVSPYGNNPHR